MTDLICHIGLPRTGTTTIQKVLHPLPGYLGKLKGVKPGTDRARSLKRITPAADLARWQRQAEAWAADVVAWQQRWRPSVERLILSDEGLARIDPSRDAGLTG